MEPSGTSAGISQPAFFSFALHCCVHAAITSASKHTMTSRPRKPPGSSHRCVDLAFFSITLSVMLKSPAVAFFGTT
ncbi:hypothetical protein QBC46DRAFT_127907 [Diplogelasinospora grovesii]|uniref:Uncharacterized protein n=1 Tax=Diplogelasinospora grovesii TaxID=303347 RepID=A0AAN6S4K1_9PEZI|nr:hypothetical protein QBC46DRAFT_127907 [Diplogelasinospora grovesii]